MANQTSSGTPVNNASSANSTAQGGNSGANNKSYIVEDVCDLGGKDAGEGILAPVVLERPEGGDNYEVFLQPGAKYFFDFEKGDAQSFVQNDGSLTISFADGGQITLHNFGDVTTAEMPAELAFADDLNVDELASLIQVLNGGNEKDGLEETPLAEIRDEDGQDVAEIEPASGDDIASQLAQVEPAAGEAQGALANSGFTFDNPNDTPINPLGAVGPLGPTALAYGVNFPEPDLIITPPDEPSVGPDGSPFAVLGAVNLVDETDLDDNGTESVEGQLDVDFGADGPGAIEPNGDVTVDGSVAGGELTSDGSPVTISAVDGGYVGMTDGGEVIFTLTIDPLTGEYQFNLLGNLDHADMDDPNDLITLTFGVVVSDADGDTVNTTITINVADDGPVVGDSTSNVDETDGFNQYVDGQIDIDGGLDGVDTVTLSTDYTVTGSATDGQLTSGGEPVMVMEVNGALVGQTPSGDVIFTLQIDPETGLYRFTQYGPVDHADGTDPNDILSITFNVHVTDGDGDAGEGTITINIADDGPSIETDAGRVDEDTLADGGVIVRNGQLDHDFGADGEGEITPDANSDVVVMYEAGQDQSQPLTSGGEVVDISATADGYVGMVNGQIAFTVTIDPATGEFTYTQYMPFDHPDTGDNNDVIWLKLPVQITDADGDTDTGYIQIDIQDSGPTANDDTGSVDDDTPVLTGDVTDNDEFGGDGTPSDGGEVKSVEFNGETFEMPEDGMLTINGEFGVLNINEDGSYTYTAYGDQSGVDVFTYTICDADGDMDTATLTINVSDTNDVPQLIEPAAQSVDETDLDADGVSVTGQVIADFGDDGPGYLSPDGDVNVSGSVAGGELTSNGSPVTISAVTGGYVAYDAGGNLIFQLTIDPETGEYTFTQYGVLDHADPNDPNDVITIDFGVVGVDADGDMANTDITINIYDDGPSAINDTADADFSDGVTEGNVLDNDNLSNDVDNDVTSVRFGDTEVEVPAEGTVTIDGDYGTLQIAADGSYTYTLFDGVELGGESTAEFTPDDVAGFQNTLTQDGITITSSTGEDLTWVDIGDGGGVGIAGGPRGSDKIFLEGESMIVDFAPAEQVTFTLADIGTNNADCGIDFVVTLADGSQVSLEIDLSNYTIVDGLVDITLSADMFGGLLIDSVDLSSYVNSNLEAASFLINSVNVQYPGEDFQDQFEYTVTDADGDSSTATLTINGDVDGDGAALVSGDDTDGDSGMITSASAGDVISSVAAVQNTLQAQAEGANNPTVMTASVLMAAGLAEAAQAATSATVIDALAVKSSATLDTAVISSVQGAFGATDVEAAEKLAQTSSVSAVEVEGEATAQTRVFKPIDIELAEARLEELLKAVAENADVSGAHGADSVDVDHVLYGDEFGVLKVMAGEGVADAGEAVKAGDVAVLEVAEESSMKEQILAEKAQADGHDDVLTLQSYVGKELFDDTDIDALVFRAANDFSTDAIKKVALDGVVSVADVISVTGAEHDGLQTSINGFIQDTQDNHSPVVSVAADAAHQGHDFGTSAQAYEAVTAIILEMPELAQKSATDLI